MRWVRCSALFVVVTLNLLRDGSNLLAVEVHQTGAWDPDSSFAVRVQAGA